MPTVGIFLLVYLLIMIIESRNAKPFRQADKIGFC